MTKRLPMPASTLPPRMTCPHAGVEWLIRLPSRRCPQPGRTLGTRPGIKPSLGQGPRPDSDARAKGQGKTGPALLLALVAALGGTVSAALAGETMFKYVDENGKVHYALTAPEGGSYRLEWRRTARKVVRNRPAPTARTKDLTGASPSSAVQRRRADYEALIAAAAQREGLEVGLVHAVIRAESAYDPQAVSRAGAQGLMQLMPATAARFGVTDTFDPAENIRGGTAYLKFLLKLFEDDLDLALAGYNAGEGAVLQHGRRIPPYPETQSYVLKVRQYLAAEDHGDHGTVTAAR